MTTAAPRRRPRTGRSRPGSSAPTWTTARSRRDSRRSGRAPEFVGGAPIESYEVRYRTWTVVGGQAHGDGGWQLWPHGTAATSTTITGLDPDTD